MGAVKDYYTLVLEILDGLWGNGEERKRRLEAAGYDYNVVQSYVNKYIEDNYNWDDDEKDEDTLIVYFDTSKYKSIKVVLE